MATCPICGTAYDGTPKTCQACGAALGEATASFEPVATGAGVAIGAQEESGDSPVLVVRKGPQLGERFYLESQTLAIGRDPKSDIFLNDVTVSREHACLERGPDGVTVSDVGSLNGTYVNGSCVEKALLDDGDVLQIGTFQMVFFGGQRPG